MSIQLQKGGKVSLTKLAADAGAPLRQIVVACGWDVNQKTGGFFSREEDYDLDLSAAALDASGRVPDRDDPTDPGYQEWFVFANHRHPSNGSIRFLHDNRTGEGDGDDEQIEVDLTLVPPEIERIIYGVVIWRAEERHQRFGNVENAYIRIYDAVTGKELLRFDIGPDFSNETFVMFGELYRRNGEWKFNAIGQGYSAAAYRQERNIKRPFETEYARFNN